MNVTRCHFHAFGMLCLVDMSTLLCDTTTTRVYDSMLRVPSISINLLIFHQINANFLLFLTKVMQVNKKMTSIRPTPEATAVAGSFANKIAAMTTKQMYLNAKLADIFFVPTSCKEIMIPAHTNILASASSMFETIFFGGTGSTKVKSIAPTGIEMVEESAEAIRQFLQFFYLTEVKLTMTEIDDVMNLCKKYEVPDSLDTCTTFLMECMRSDDILLGYRLGVKHEQKKLIDFCERKIEKDATDIIRSSSFLKFDRELVGRIMHMNTPSCSDMDKIKASVAWAKAECDRKKIDSTRPKNQREQLGDIFSKLPFKSLRPNDFFALVPQCLALLKARELREILKFIAKKADDEVIKSKVY